MKKLLYIFIIGLVVTGCKKEEDSNLPPNPYEGINPMDSGKKETPLDPATIQGLHQNIFSQKCATLGCHDGSFEPDYRTIQSTYYTLVYADVFKQQGDFKYRVIPGDTANSWLWNRVTTDDPVLGRMPLYSPSLTQEELNNLSAWILGGAKDINGNSADKQNNKPTLYGFAIFDANTQFRYDSLRDGRINNPMQVPSNTLIDIWVGVSDDSTNIWELTVNEVKFSKNINDFSSATAATLVFNTTPMIVPKFIYNSTGTFYYKLTVNTSQWNPGDIVYLRLYTDDGDHEEVTELPNNYDNNYLKTRYSMEIQ